MAAKTKIGAAEPEPRPEPVPQNVVCSVCGMQWHQHGDNPGLMTCIRLLKAELARRPATWTTNPIVMHPITTTTSGSFRQIS
jgi:hypothetical protein